MLHVYLGVFPTQDPRLPQPCVSPPAFAAAFLPPETEMRQGREPLIWPLFLSQPLSPF